MPAAPNILRYVLLLDLFAEATMSRGLQLAPMGCRGKLQSTAYRSSGGHTREQCMRTLVCG